jgi:predicted phosphate transport protein (TIGR00153 family)
VNLFQRFFTRGEDFYSLLHAHSQVALDCMTLLNTYMVDGDPEIGNRIILIEREADEMRRILLDCLDRSLVTPIDREDIYNVSNAMDEILDYARSTVEEMDVFELKPNDGLRAMVSSLLSATDLLNTAIKHLKLHKAISAENTTQAKKLENAVERLYRSEIKELLKEDDFRYILMMREVYRHISNLADRVDHAADYVKRIVLKTI